MRLPLKVAGFCRWESHSGMGSRSKKLARDVYASSMTWTVMPTHAAI